MLAGNEGSDRQAFPLEPRRLGGKVGFAQSRMGPGIKIVQAVDAGKVCAGVAQGVYVLGLHRRSVELDGHDAAEQGRLSHVEAVVQAGCRDAQFHQLLRLKAVGAEDGRRLGRYVGDDV